MYDNSSSWGDYPDERSQLPMGDLDGGMGLLYVPDLSDPGHGSAYYPGDTRGDAEALNFLGYMTADELAAHVGTTGSAGGDMAARAGAWNPLFQSALKQYQDIMDLTPDGWIGPVSRRSMLGQVLQKNALLGIDNLPIPPIPPGPIPIPPGPFPPPGPNVLPGPAPGPIPIPPGPSGGGGSNVLAKKDNTLRNVGIGVGVLAGVGLLYYALK